MANSRAILRGLKAAQSRSQNEARSPLAGGASPLVQQYQQWIAGSAYGPALPRPAAEFLTGAFGPLAPIQPVPIDAPEDGQERPEPRRWEYPVGWNMPIGVPGTEGLKLASFDTLRTYADLYSVARQCIQIRKDEVTGLGWDIQMTTEAEKAARGDRQAHRDFQERRQKALKFFAKPDPNYADYASWLNAVLEDVFVIDALSLYLHPARGKGSGLLGSNLAALDVIDGSTVRPLVDLRGSTPAPPAVAYQQYLWGVPRSDLMAIAANDDVNQMQEALVAEYRGDQLLYLPYTRRTWTPYGFGPVERCVLPLVTGLMRQKYAYDFFQEGSIPGVFVTPTDTTLTANQVREMQDALNAMAGDPAWKHKIVVLPGKADPMKPITLADQYDEVVMGQVAMAFDIKPEELGVMMGRSSRSMQDQQKSTEVRPSLRPLMRWLKANVFDRVLRDVCGQGDMQWSWEGMDADATQAQVATLKDQVMVGFASIDEARQELGRMPWGLPMTSDPGILTATGFVPLGSIDPETGKPLDTQPAQQPSQSPAAGNAPAGPGRPAGPAAPLPPSSGTDSASRGGTPLHDGSQAAVQPAGKVPQKAMASELDALRRHLHKGRQISTWSTRYLPAHALAAISEDLAKGLTVDQAVAVTGALLLKDDADPESSWPGWEHDQAVADHYAPLIAGALRAGIDPQRMARDWLAASRMTAVKAAGNDAGGWLTGQGIVGRVFQTLKGVLTRLWTEAWHLGGRSATAVVHGGPADWGSWTPGDHEAAGLLASGAQGLQDLLDTYGISTIHSIVDTRMGELAHVLEAALEAGDSTEQLARDIRGILERPDRAQMIADTETARAVSQSALDEYRHDGVTEVEWNVTPDERACQVCLDNAGQGPVPIGHQFGHKPGTADAPPAHPGCRCVLLPAAFGPVRLAATPDVEKVGPKGYIHGWIYVGPQAVGARVFHPAHGHGTVTGRDDQHVTVRFDRGHERTFEHASPRQGEQFVPREPKPSMGEVSLPPMELDGADQHLAAEVRERVEAFGQEFPDALATVKRVAVIDGMPSDVFAQVVSKPGGPSEVQLNRLWYTNRSQFENSVLVAGVHNPHESDVAFHPLTTTQSVIDHELGHVLDAANGWTASSAPVWSMKDYTHKVSLYSEHSAAEAFAEAFAVRQAKGSGELPELLRMAFRNVMQNAGGDANKAAAEPTCQGYVPPWAMDVVGPPAQVKSRARLVDGRQVPAQVVIDQMRGNFPDQALEWMKGIRWVKAEVPHDAIDYGDADSWAASSQPKKVRKFVKKLRKGKPVNPVVAVQQPGKDQVVIVDGHHRTLAHKQLDQPVPAYVGFVPRKVGPWLRTFQYQRHSGSNPANKALHAEAVKVDEGEAGDVRARHLIRWYNEGADGQIPWGSPGDFDACVAVAGRHMDREKAKGFCANRHHDALGIWPATHAAELRGKVFDTDQPRGPDGRWISVGGELEHLAHEVSGTTFHRRIAAARGAARGPFLSLYTPEEYSHMRCFVSHGGKVGGALKDHGDGRVEIVSLFNNGGPRGSGRQMIQHLIANGGNYLECYGDGLRGIYEGQGFHVTDRFEFDDSLASADWNYDRDGRPPYYLMRLGRDT